MTRTITWQIPARVRPITLTYKLKNKGFHSRPIKPTVNLYTLSEELYPTHITKEVLNAYSLILMLKIDESGRTPTTLSTQNKQEKITVLSYFKVTSIVF